MLTERLSNATPILCGFYVHFLYFYVSVFSVFTFILRTMWWGGTVLIFPAGKDAKAVGRLSRTDSHHPQVVVELEFEICLSVWLEEPYSACPKAPSWLMAAICGSSLLGPRAWAALPSTGPDSPDETRCAFSWPEHLTLRGWIAEGWTLNNRKNWTASMGKWGKGEGHPEGPASNSPWQHREAGAWEGPNSLASASSEKPDFHLWLLTEWEITPYLILLNCTWIIQTN